MIGIIKFWDSKSRNLLCNNAMAYNKHFHCRAIRITRLMRNLRVQISSTQDNLFWISCKSEIQTHDHHLKDERCLYSDDLKYEQTPAALWGVKVGSTGINLHITFFHPKIVYKYRYMFYSSFLHSCSHDFYDYEDPYPQCLALQEAIKVY
jgi:hypothetical protein